VGLAAQHGEHGVGILKKNWLTRELGSDAAGPQRGLKELFDPYGILNPANCGDRHGRQAGQGCRESVDILRSRCADIEL
jgi:hypothetical protein